MKHPYLTFFLFNSDSTTCFSFGYRSSNECTQSVYLWIKYDWCLSYCSFLVQKHFVSFCIMMVAVVCSTRYMFFRITQTLVFPSWIDMIFGILLLIAEIYVYMVLLLSFFQLSWSLKRKIVPLPKDTFMANSRCIYSYLPSH